MEAEQRYNPLADIQLVRRYIDTLPPGAGPVLLPVIHSVGTIRAAQRGGGSAHGPGTCSTCVCECLTACALS